MGTAQAPAPLLSGSDEGSGVSRPKTCKPPRATCCGGGGVVPIEGAFCSFFGFLGKVTPVPLADEPFPVRALQPQRRMPLCPGLHQEGVSGTPRARPV